MSIEVQCNCGAVRMELSGEPVAQFYCHCDDCQKAVGAAYLPIAVYPADAVVVVAGDPNMRSLERTPRGTCRDCGTWVFAEPPGAGIRGVNAFLLPEGQFEPTFHSQCQHAVVPVQDGLPHFKGFPPAFGGSDETVDW